MELFTETAATYATRANAIRKLSTVVGDLRDYHWLISTNEQGRFIPVVIGSQHMHLAHSGICVAG